MRLLFKRSQSNQYQSRVRFHFRGVYNKILNGRVLTGQYDCQDEQRSGRPNEVTTPEMAKKIHKMVLHDRRLKMCKGFGVRVR